MASSILSGDRRCSAVRGKMTVIGKLPKPINLPSQKLENRGLDPNVEIVPKGTLTWGSKSSVPTPNAWTSSALSSPYTDGTASSPVSGRPASGGGGPRPSTSGSDRSHEAVSSTWGSNSRPSSASGILATNQTSLGASRPQSAETRPGSSQLSRFAENSSENTTPSWPGNTGTAERGGSGTSKSSGFMLISGEFPSLGSEKNPEQQMQRGHSSQGRPTSASSSSAQKEASGNPADGKMEPCSGNNSGKMETQPHVGGGPPPNNESWQRNSLQGQPYPTVNMPPPQFDAWRGSPVRPPDGIWYTVGTAGGPFRPAGPPGSYPIDHFAFYPSQHPGPLPNSQPVPRPGPSLGVHYLKNGEAYRPQLSQESYAVPNHPIISVRPGLYQSPPPYDGYLGPRASFCNPTDREVPTTGAVGPGIYNQFNRNANVEPGKFLVRPDIRPSIIPKEQAKSGQFSEIHQGQYKVLLKQHDICEDKDVEGKKEHSTLDSSLHSEDRKQYDSTTHEDGMKNRSKNEGSTFVKTVPVTETSQSASDWDGHSSNVNTRNSLKDSSKRTSEGLVKRTDGFTSVPGHDQQPYSVVKKDAYLMERIEVLNNKARNIDGDCEGAQFLAKEVKNHKVLGSHIENPVQVLCANNKLSRTSGTYLKGRSVPHQTGASKAEKVQYGKVSPHMLESQVITVSVSACPEDSQKLQPQAEKRVPMTQGPFDDPTKSRRPSQNDNESIKRTSDRSSLETVPSRKSEIGTVTNLPDFHTSQEMVGKLELNYTSNAGSGLYAASSSIENDDLKSQRAKQKELAAQRAKELQKEEVERDREQKAKAHAKLKELNRRSLAQAVDQNPNSAATPIKGGQLKQDFGGIIAFTKDNAIDEAPVGGVPAVTTAVVNPSTNSDPGWPRDPSLHFASQQSKLSSCIEGNAPPRDCSLGQDANISGLVTHKSGPHFQENNFSKHKRLGYRKKQNSLQEKNPCEQPANLGDPENCSEAPIQELAVEALPVISEMPMQHKKKNNRTSKNKMKMEEASSGSTLPSCAQNEINDGTYPIDDRKTQSSVSDVMPNPSQSVDEMLNSLTSKDVVPSSYPEGSAQASEEQHGRINNQWKSQSSRRSTRYQQAIRTGEKFHGSEAVIWAPVKPQSRISISDEANQKNGNESSGNPSTNSGHDAQNGVKTKRAEMERYVPKPVAKELPLQNSQQNSSTINLAASSDVTVGPDSGGPEIATDCKIGDDNRPNRRSKTHPSRSSHEGYVSSYPANPSGKHYDQHQFSKFDSVSEEQIKCDDPKGNFHNLASIEALPVLKDHSVINKQRYQRYKPAGSSRHKASLNYNKVLHNGSHDKCDGPASDLQLNEVCASDALGNAIPHFGSENKKTHWQPKSQPQSDRHGQRGTGNQKATPQSGKFGNELHPQSIGNCPHFESNDSCTVNIETGNASKQEVKASGEFLREQIHLSNHPTNVEPSPQVDSQQEQPVSATFRRRGTNSDRFSRGQESVHRGRHVGQDASRPNSHFSGDKLKNSRFEYEQTGSHNKPRDLSQYDSAGPETQEAPRAPGPRHRGRGQSNIKRGGNFYGRNSGAAVGASHYYNSEE